MADKQSSERKGGPGLYARTNCPYCGEAVCENPAACNQAARIEQEPDEPEEDNHDVECPINCRLCEEKLAEHEAEADAAQQASFYDDPRWGENL